MALEVPEPIPSANRTRGQAYLASLGIELEDMDDELLAYAMESDEEEDTIPGVTAEPGEEAAFLGLEWELREENSETGDSDSQGEERG